MGDKTGGGNRKGRSGGGGSSGATSGDAGQPGEVVRAANQFNEERVLSAIKSGSIGTKELHDIQAVASAQRKAAEREIDALYSANNRKGMSIGETRRTPEFQRLEARRKEAGRLHSSVQTLFYKHGNIIKDTG